MKDEDFKKLEQLVDDLDHKVCGDDCNVCVLRLKVLIFAI